MRPNVAPWRLGSVTIRRYRAGMSIPASLAGKKALIVGIANDQSIAAGCAAAMRNAGADLAVTYLNAKAEKHVRAVTEALGADFLIPLDVREPGALERCFAAVTERWGKLDILLHSIAFAPREDLHARVTDSSRDGFLQAMDVSCHSFVRMAKLAEPLMTQGGTLLTVSFYGAEKAVENYNLMGPVKAALEASVRAIAAELGPKNIRAHAISPGPLLTRAASGIDRFDELVERAKTRSPGRRLVTIEEIGALAAFLSTDAAAGMTGGVHYVDAGYNIVG
jgi:enoyl-[acyl-carrier protein] reductase I